MVATPRVDFRGAKAVVRPLIRRFDDSLDRIRGRPVSPWALRSQVPGDFRKIGQEFLGYMVRFGGLKPDAHVLEIGHRAGRMAIPLTRYLGPDARYEGVDDWEEGTAWCQAALTPRYPNFRFRNVRMIPDEGDSAAGRHPEPAPLPYEDGTFDLVILASIVHLPPTAFYQLLREAARVMRTGGTYFGTWFLLDQPRSKGRSVPPTACSESDARQRLWSLNLEVQNIRRGRWDGHEPSLSYQDLVIARKWQ